MAKFTKAQKWRLASRSDFLAERYALDVVSNKAVREALMQSRHYDEMVHLENLKGFLSTAFMTGFFAGLAGSDVMTQMMRNNDAARVADLQSQYDAAEAARKAEWQARLRRAKARNKRK